jgi:outer membrane protein TolC
MGGRLVFALVALLPATSLADDAVAYTPPDFLSATPPLPSTIDASTAWRLDLGEALQLAVKQNLGVTLERKNVRVAELGVDVARGLVEPTVDASYVHGSSRIPPTTINPSVASTATLTSATRRRRFMLEGGAHRKSQRESAEEIRLANRNERRRTWIRRRLELPIHQRHRYRSFSRRGDANERCLPRRGIHGLREIRRTRARRSGIVPHIRLDRPNR